MLQVRDCASAAEVLANVREVKARMRALSPPPPPQRAEPPPVPAPVEMEQAAAPASLPEPLPTSECMPLPAMGYRLCYRGTPRQRWQELVEISAEEFGVRVRDVLGPWRTVRVVAARHMAMYLVRYVSPHLSLPAIGRLFGGRDHTTILNAVRRVEARRDADPDYDRRIRELLARFRADA
jgi:hypothetical protein